MKHDSGLQEKIATAVAAVEEVSSLEVVVTLSPRAIPVTVPALLSALVTGILLLFVYALFFPAASPKTIAIDTLAISLLASLAVRGLPPLQRLFIPRQGLEEAVATAARAEFVRQGVHVTRGRTGLLLYLSAFERRALMVPDIGVTALIPAEEMARLEQAAAAIYGSPDPADGLVAFFDMLHRVGSRYLPKADDDTDELANGLRTR